MRTAILALLAGCVSLLLMLAARADDLPSADVALVLAADVSVSMKAEEVELQRQAYAAALTHPDTAQAIAEGAHGHIWVAYFEWSSCEHTPLIVAWTRVETADDLRKVASQIIAADARPDVAMTTCVSGAMQAANALLASKPEVVERMVVDVSGDGIDNHDQRKVVAARDALVATGATINGLPMMMDPDGADIVGWYTRNVMGGPAAFVEPAKGVHDLERALRRKLVQEIG